MADGRRSGPPSVRDRPDRSDGPDDDRRSERQWIGRAEAFVLRNRFTIAVVFPVVGAAVMLASAAGLLPEPLRFNAALLLFGTAVMRLPLAVALAPLLDRRAVTALAALVGYTYAIEFVGTTTGWPYGAFAYGVELGPMAAGVPLALPLFFVPLVLDSYLLATLLSRGRVGRLGRIAGAVAAVLVVDLALDPAAVALGFWSFEAGGAYYGVPLSNYVGWAISGTVGVVLAEFAFGGPATDRRIAECPFALDDLVSFVLLWSVVNAAFGNWLAVAAAALLGGALVGSSYVAPGALDRTPVQVGEG